MIFLPLIIFLGLILILAGILWIFSPGKVEHYLDSRGKILAGSLSEKIFIRIGGISQGMFIKSKNLNRPILLYIHGGPAFPNYFLIDKYHPELEDYFTVCYWEQRGGGLSYNPEVSLESMNFQQLSSDALDVSHYLQKRFGKEKIYIMAHSGGTPIALLAISKEPKLFYAYIGMGQISYQAESEKLAYQYLWDQFLAKKNLKKLAELQKFQVFESNSSLISFYNSPIRDQSMHEMGIGTIHTMKSVFWDIFIPVWLCRAYTLNEKINIWKSKFSFLPKTQLIPEMLETNFTLKVPKLDIPVYFLSGKYDYTVNIDLSRAYLKSLKAPIKGFYTFQNSAHSPLFEEPEKVRRVIEEDVLKQRAFLADK